MTTGEYREAREILNTRFLCYLMKRQKGLAKIEEPYALTDAKIAALEKAIRAEGYDILYDTDTGEFTLRRNVWVRAEPVDTNCPYCGKSLEAYQHEQIHHCAVPAIAEGGHTRITFKSNSRGNLIEIHQRITGLIA